MGIDAEMLLRVKRSEKPSDDELARWSWDLCRAIGARHFYTHDGMEPEAYAAAQARWTATWEKTGQNREATIALVGEHPEELRRAIQLSPSYEENATEPGRVWSQDGEPILADEGEWLLSVNLSTRYYGIGYERGDLLTICATAEWCEMNIPNCEVWYGGDSSGVLAEPFGEAQRCALKAHLYSQRGRDYFSYDMLRGETKIEPTPCGLCIPSEPRFNRNGWGKDFAAVSCAGCGKSFETRDNGKTWQVRKDD